MLDGDCESMKNIISFLNYLDLHASSFIFHDDASATMSQLYLHASYTALDKGPTITL